MYESYLVHHGILGMKWGIRRFQNEDGSLTSEGRRRYKYDVEGSKNKYILAKNSYNKEKSVNNKIKMDLAKDEYVNNKIKEKLSKENGITDHRRKLESYFKDQGMTNEEAQIAAYKRDKTEKIVIGALTAAAVTATAIVIKKQYDKRVDGYLNKGLKLHRVTDDEVVDTERAFYASYKALDRLKYRGIYGNQLGGLMEGNTINDIVLETNSKIKIASPQNAKNALQTVLSNDSDGMKALKDTLGEYAKLPPTQKHGRLYESAKRSLEKGIINDDVYKAYNICLVSHGNSDLQRVHDSFYSLLKQRGYGAILDHNDKYMNAFKSRKPVIIFGGSNSVTQKAVKQLSSKTIGRDLAASLGIISGRNAAKIGAVVGSAKVAQNARSNYNRDSRLNAEDLEYRREHRNTRMTLEQIRRMLEENRYAK